MAENEGVTEDLKRQSQRVWIRAMNNITCCAEEIIKSELFHSKIGETAHGWRRHGPYGLPLIPLLSR